MQLLITKEYHLEKLKVFSILLACLMALVLTSCDTFALGGDGRTSQTFTVTFGVNGGSGTAPSTQTVNAGSSIVLPSGSGLTRSGFSFGGWNTNTAGTGINYPTGSSFTPTANITLYAKWDRSAAQTFRVTFSTNGGSGTAPSAQTVNAGSSIILPSGSGLTRSGFSFGGWNTNTAGTGINYSAGSSFSPTANITLHARWISSGSANYGTVTFINETNSPINLTSSSLRPNSFTLGPHSRRVAEIIHIPVIYTFTLTNVGVTHTNRIEGAGNHTSIFRYGH
jgi:uncharacterized repeat protein (TIGR02543 family)